MATPPGSPRHALVLAYYVPPLGMSGVQRVSKLLKYLPEFGWRSTLVAPRPGAYFAYDESLMADIERDGVRIERTPSLDPTRLVGGARAVGMPAESKRRRLSEASQYVFVPDNKIGWLPFALAAMRRVIARDRPDVIFASAPPYTGALAGAVGGRLSGCPLVLDFRDDWLGNPRHVYPTPFHRSIQAWMERTVTGRADAVLTINDVIARSLGSRAMCDVRVVPQGFDPEDFDARPDRRPETFRLVYTGVFYDAQRPDVLLRAARSFLDRHPNAPLELVFAGAWLDDTPDLINTLALTSYVDFRGYLPHAEVVRLQQSAAVLWMVIGQRDGSEQISTGKLFEYVGARRPILALVPPGAAREELTGHGDATICSPDDVTAVADSLAELYDRWRSDRLTGPGPEYVARYDRRRIAGEVASIFDSVIHDHPRA